jgi:thiol-disulfide isomerase/thioredoxin/outer membrane lipoprotein-sorting protein
MKKVLVGVLCVAGWTWLAAAQEPNPKDIVKKADAATKAVKAVSYAGEFHGEGRFKDQVPKITGKAMLKKGGDEENAGQPIWASLKASFRVEGKIQPPDEDEAAAFTVVFNGKQGLRLAPADKTFGRADGAKAAALVGPAESLLMQEYIHPNPFGDEINGQTLKYEGTKKIGDVDCDVIYVVYQAGAGKARWFFGKDDHLPRRVDRIMGGDKDAVVLVVTDLKLDPKIDEATFSVKPPEGYKETKAAAEEDEEEESSSGLAAGTSAPAWSLTTPDGKTVTLASLKGKVVVMDFWATWCGPCKQAMPGIQKISEQYKDKPVMVYGISTWERGEDKVGPPAAYMKDKKYTYGLLVKGDDVAKQYKVSGIPTFYVIDPAGKIVYADSGYSEAGEQKLAKAIDKALGKSAGEKEEKGKGEKEDKGDGDEK